MTDNKGSFPVIYRETFGKWPSRRMKERARSFIYLSEFPAPLPALGWGWNRAIYSALPAVLVPSCACCFLHKVTARRARGDNPPDTCIFPIGKDLQVSHNSLDAPVTACWDGLRERCVHCRPQHPPRALWRHTWKASHWGHGDVAMELPQPPARCQFPVNAADRGTTGNTGCKQL